ncbi:MAG: murein hydrolase activator EnvC [Halioglobus sp.]
MNNRILNATLPTKHLRRFGRRLACLSIALCALQPINALADDEAEQTRIQIQKLEKDIKRISREIDTASAQRGKVQNNLKKADIELGRVQRSIKENRAAVLTQEAELKTLEAEQSALQAAGKKQRTRIAAEMKTAWQMGRESQLKMLLSQEEPDKVARSMTYYRYFFEARNEILEDYRETLLSLEKVQANIDQTLSTLATRRAALQTEENSLEKAKLEQQIALNQLVANISSKSARLKKLETDRTELEKLLVAIEEAIVQLELPQNVQSFAKTKGRMPWPVAGKHSNRFGRSRNAGKMRWQGITIAANEGTVVNAVHHGRVVYSDWLRGSGLLLIIDHGDGYMSLYAHNQSLLKDVGEWVTSDTPISTVGNSGGQDEHALYFEVRYAGKPVDPAKWCEKRP